jgi:hypothetical protein
VTSLTVGRAALMQLYMYTECGASCLVLRPSEQLARAARRAASRAERRWVGRQAGRLRHLLDFKKAGLLESCD